MNLLKPAARGADIARRLRFPEAVAEGIAHLDEHWNGGGQPQWLVAETIPLYSRIALLAQIVDVKGRRPHARESASAVGVGLTHSFVPPFHALRKHRPFGPHWHPAVCRMRSLHWSRSRVVALDDDYLDDIAAAFGQVVDSKSPYTSGHSVRVARYTDQIAEHLGLAAGRRRWLRRGALLHDMGKLGVSNMGLDKPGKLDAQEWAAVQ